MMNKEYKTILGHHKVEIEIKKSIFIANVKRCNTEEESLEFIREISKQHKDATHNCTAYINGETKLTQRYNDDGEPQGTAGIPMLEVLLKEDLTDLAVVVTRYFGGKKLGASGLIRAYGSSVSEVLKVTPIVWLKNYHKVNVEFDYTYLGAIDNYFNENNIFIKQRDYLENIKNILYLDVNEFDTIKSKLLDMTSANIKIEILETLLLQNKDGEIIE